MMTTKHLVRTSEFKAGKARECFLAVQPPSGLPLGSSLDVLFDAYSGALADMGLGESSEVRLRLHLSDIENQAELVRERLARRDAFVSMYGQASLAGAKVLLEAYHVDAPAGAVRKRMLPGGALELAHGAYRSLWRRYLPGKSGYSYAQTQGMFAALRKEVGSLGGTLADNLLRTWIYVRDIDNNYQGMVDARRELFEDEGLTSETHFVASTGIQGNHEKPGDLVGMDALVLLGHGPEQVRQLSALDHLCPTHAYNVTFERGTQVRFGDRNHCYISGTASIDAQGNVVHVGDVARQTERTVENIAALLADGDAGLEHLASMVVYVRDQADAESVAAVLAGSGLGEVPCVFVHGSVCRPAWLVEIEGIAISPARQEGVADFC